MGKLTVSMVKQLTAPGRYGDGNTLYLYIAPSGSKSWVQRIRVKGERRDIGLGSASLRTLSEARIIAQRNRLAVLDGNDPTAGRRKSRKKARRKAQKKAIPKFSVAARQTHEAKLPTWRNPKVAANWIQRLERHAFSRLGKIRVHKIDRADVLDVLVPIWASKPETARKVRSAIYATLARSISYGHIQSGVNAAGECLDGALPTMPLVKRHMRALPHGQVAGAIAKVAGSGAHVSTRLAFQFLVLTAVRSGDVRGATWAEIDLQGAVWTIPGTRTKTGREHRVPLSGAALDVLRAVDGQSGPHGLVFPSARGKVLSDATMSKLCKENEVGAVPHGFRSSFRDWCAEAGKPREIAEAALAHVVGGVEGAYLRSDLFDRRRRLMDSWAVYLTGSTAAKVVKLRA